MLILSHVCSPFTTPHSLPRPLFVVGLHRVQQQLTESTSATQRPKMRFLKWSERCGRRHAVGDVRLQRAVYLFSKAFPLAFHRHALPGTHPLPSASVRWRPPRYPLEPTLPQINYTGSLGFSWHECSGSTGGVVLTVVLTVIVVTVVVAIAVHLL